ncbi:hypothetical protein SAMN04488029_0911 [Reichenbachiella faecimaris]|uniref:Helix-turn-helix domain-containing protein n=1 Tax=Reichenbachiella faecimaris TaxID=692418 RepID=A0A1W2G7T0_REIFA|nr:hypothetical protein [Reichenbachiella faecimaris]SMD32564.1 hypothetical protein SAMN04488029_0911 [Reichenbachiella faecimaris]
MEGSSVKQIIELPSERFEEFIENQNKILGALENLKMVPRPEFLTASEFMFQAKIGRWKFDQLRDQNRIKVIRRGKKLYVPESEVNRYFLEEDE